MGIREALEERERERQQKPTRQVTAACSGRSCNQENLYNAPANTPDHKWMCTGCKLWEHVVGNEPAPETQRSFTILEGAVICDDVAPPRCTSIPRVPGLSTHLAVLDYSNSAYSYPHHMATRSDVHIVRTQPDGTDVFRIDWSDGPEFVEVRP